MLLHLFCTANGSNKILVFLTPIVFLCRRFRFFLRFDRLLDICLRFGTLRKIINIHCTIFNFCLIKSKKLTHKYTHLDTMLCYIEYFTFFSRCLLANFFVLCNTIFIEVSTTNGTTYHSLWWRTSQYNLCHENKFNVNNLITKCQSH